VSFSADATPELIDSLPFRWPRRAALILVPPPRKNYCSDVIHGNFLVRPRGTPHAWTCQRLQPISLATQLQLIAPLRLILVDKSCCPSSANIGQLDEGRPQ